MKAVRGKAKAASPAKPVGQTYVRIIAGSLRGSKLAVPAVPGLRPTPDRVRETLFNWLAFLPTRQIALDLFAGSGALGIEALSRGVPRVDFVDSEAQVIQKIQADCERLKVSQRCRWYTQAAEHAIAQLPAQYDLVFLDPPFAAGLWPACLQALCAHQKLSAGALIYLEYPIEQQAQFAALPLTIFKQARAGAVGFGLYTVKPS